MRHANERPRRKRLSLGEPLRDRRQGAPAGNEHRSGPRPARGCTARRSTACWPALSSAAGRPCASVARCPRRQPRRCSPELESGHPERPPGQPLRPGAPGGDPRRARLDGRQGPQARRRLAAATGPPARGRSLRARPARRAAAHRHQAPGALSHGGQADPSPTASSARPERAGSTCTWPSTTAAGSPTARCWPGQGAEHSCAFLERAVAWFTAEHGIGIERVLSDNGHAYRSHAWAATCERLGIERRRTRPYTPRTNGKAEALIGTLLREWAWRYAYPSKRPPHPGPVGLGALVQPATTPQLPGRPAADQPCRAGPWSVHLERWPRCRALRR